ncbi:hypothetical protein [Argonema antarcticum]|uniref:hypothetical protein n=1 Tax=Argonema antarcticum TaxID=2942763 RepID=UPI002012915A|nr:hypothetical protein [Argonema antarcticum]MCL1475853.1 hypothetical protein [Argonema antarcticum A004/B2]
MSKLVRLRLQYPLAVIQEVKEIVAIALANPRDIVIDPIRHLPVLSVRSHLYGLQLTIPLAWGLSLSFL